MTGNCTPFLSAPWNWATAWCVTCPIRKGKCSFLGWMEGKHPFRMGCQTPSDSCDPSSANSLRSVGSKSNPKLSSGFAAWNDRDGEVWHDQIGSTWDVRHVPVHWGPSSFVLSRATMGHNGRMMFERPGDVDVKTLQAPTCDILE